MQKLIKYIIFMLIMSFLLVSVLGVYSKALAGGHVSRKAITIVLDSHPEFAFYGKTILGDDCFGGLYLKDKLPRHIKRLVKNGPKETQKEYNARCAKIFSRAWEINIK